jgi:hypothetical protein
LADYSEGEKPASTFGVIPNKNITVTMYHKTQFVSFLFIFLPLPHEKVLMSYDNLAYQDILYYHKFQNKKSPISGA